MAESFSIPDSQGAAANDPPQATSSLASAPQNVSQSAAPVAGHHDGESSDSVRCLPLIADLRFLQLSADLDSPGRGRA